MAWGEIKVEEQRKQFIDACLEGKLTITELCRQYDISRKCGYKWLRRYENEGVESLKDKSRAPLKQALEIDPQTARDVLEVRFRYPTWGPKKVLAWLKSNRPDLAWPSTTTIGNLFDKNGLTVPRKRRMRVPNRTAPLTHCQQSNDVWCTDFKGWFLTGDGQKCEPFTLTDGATRFLIRCLKLKSNDTDHVWAVLSNAFHEYGLPLFLRNDNGPPFASCGVGRLSTLSVRLIKAGVTPEWIDPGKPQQNGRHERMHQTLKNETASPPEATLKKQEMKFKEFLNYYNFTRPHEAIDQKTPGSIYVPSNRIWNGRLKSPEYPSGYTVRQGRQKGEIKWKGEKIYLGSVLYGEPIGLEEQDNDIWKVVYGPIILGFINQKNQFIRPERPVQKKWKNGVE